MTDPTTPPLKAPLSQKERMAIDRLSMPEQEADLRAHNFREVNLGFTRQMAMLEAERCLQCPKPYCIDGCPVRVNIPRFLEVPARRRPDRGRRYAPRRQ